MSLKSEFVNINSMRWCQSSAASHMPSWKLLNSLAEMWIHGREQKRCLVSCWTAVIWIIFIYFTCLLMSLLVIFIPELEIIVSLGKSPRAQFLTTIMPFMWWDATAPPALFFFFLQLLTILDSRDKSSWVWADSGNFLNCFFSTNCCHMFQHLGNSPSLTVATAPERTLPLVQLSAYPPSP